MIYFLNGLYKNAGTVSENRNQVSDFQIDNKIDIGIIKK